MPAHRVLRGSDGELILVRLTVPAHDLEDSLETLAAFDFPVNPALFHRGTETAIEFPAYSGKLPQIEAALADRGHLETFSLLAGISS
ncbi:MAG: hypothetical protein ACK58M_03765 [Acidobacteriota bacterium]|jgi:hypothetical protein|nr:hypothetical protein [Bryobacteraceae bacterium CoA2 C42]MCA2963320.1 hypothetical protein [Acidobacteriaceae bacterium]